MIVRGDEDGVDVGVLDVDGGVDMGEDVSVAVVSTRGFCFCLCSSSSSLPRLCLGLRKRSSV